MPVPAMVTLLVTGNAPLVRVIVPAGKLIVDPGAASASAWRSDPVPASARLRTLMVSADAPAGQASAAAASTAANAVSPNLYRAGESSVM
jgi:hypothetical protein